MKQNHCRTKRQLQEEGFSLLEAIVAFALLSMVLIASIGFFSDGMKRVRTVVERNQEIDELLNALALSGTKTLKLAPNKKINVVRRALSNVESRLTPVLVTVSFTNDGSEFQTLQTIIIEPVRN